MVHEKQKKDLVKKLDGIVEKIYQEELLKEPLDDCLWEINKTLFRKITSAYFRANVSFKAIKKLKNDKIYHKNRKLIDKCYEAYGKTFVSIDQALEEFYKLIEFMQKS